MTTRKRKTNNETRIQNIHNQKIYNTNIFKNPPLYNVYKSGDYIHYFRYNILANSLNHVELNSNGKCRFTGNKLDAPCVPGTLHFLQLLSNSKCARTVTRQQEKSFKEQNLGPAAPLVGGRWHWPIPKGFVFVRKMYDINSTEFINLIYNIPKQYGIILGTQKHHPNPHMFSIYKDENSVLKLMLHISNSRSNNEIIIQQTNSQFYIGYFLSRILATKHFSISNNPSLVGYSLMRQ